MSGPEWLLLIAALLALLAWRPKPADPCPWCDTPEWRRDGCRQWCGAYREYMDYRKAQRPAE